MNQSYILLFPSLFLHASFLEKITITKQLSMIKKYSHQSDKTDLQQQLNAYQQQATSYRQQQNKIWKKTLRQGTLTALIPLAAASAANAQCQGAANGGATITLAPNGSYQLDVDGDGTKDLKFQMNTFNGGASFLLRLDDLNPTWQWIGTNTGKSTYGAIRLSQNYTVTNAKAFHNTAANLSLNGAFGDFSPGHATPAYIGVKKGNTPGWIQIEVKSSSTANIKFVIHERGIETDGNNSAVTGQCATLPVELLYFNTQIQNQYIVLDWATATELNNDGFEIQRSTDGLRFHKVGWVEGNGTTQGQQEYLFADKDVKTNTTYYYRLKQIDDDGTFAYSDIQTAMITDVSKVEIGEFAPNPIPKSRGVAWLETQVPEEAPVNITIFQTNGAVVKTMNDIFLAGSNRFPIHIHRMQPGLYYVKVEYKGTIEYRKLVIQ